MTNNLSGMCYGWTPNLIKKHWNRCTMIKKNNKKLISFKNISQTHYKCELTLKWWHAQYGTKIKSRNIIVLNVYNILIILIEQMSCNI